jgi:hypothetical protein
MQNSEKKAVFARKKLDGIAYEYLGGKPNKQAMALSA